MSLIHSGGHMGSIKDFPFPSSSALSLPRELLFRQTRIDWKEAPEAHVLKANSWAQEGGSESQVDSGKFLRSFRLPENAKMDQIKAAMENGVLTVTVPKAEVKKSDVKAIEISG
uniref:SHSP domain-containing protein n=1 Tax=Fagus sylvatica TaxID=28930 RepID=A0A2N9IDY4_FAGSY